ncbi:hypothetical protein pEaSNUABM44_00535 [Erwinia phage pEa_SNUABM_44]|nr:hypothetical protein pEaSNUABM44_00535 [Erwinia phage pEa_SNUABM_44]
MTTNSWWVRFKKKMNEPVTMYHFHIAMAFLIGYFAATMVMIILMFGR